MLVAFSVENYRSFKERVTLSMVAADLSSRPKELDSTNVFSARDNLNLLTSAAIYGANASGKSNLVAALNFMRTFVLNSARETVSRERVNVTPYRLSTETEQAPSRFEIVFVQQNVIYRYGFLVSRRRVDKEWLYSITSKKESYLFERDLDIIRVNERSFKVGQGLQERTRPNVLFLSVAAQWNVKRADKIVEWFENLNVDTGIASVDDRITQRRLAQRYGAEGLSPEVIAFIRSLDLGIEDVQLEHDPPEEISFIDEDGTVQTAMYPGSTHIHTIHSKYNDKGETVSSVLFDIFSHESQGTRRVFALAEPILAAIRHGTVLVVDELDARLHPILTCEIIRLFNDRKTNPKHAQLIFTTHDTNLLGSDLFRRDQIWFVEKSRHGESTLYSLIEYKVRKVRNDEAYEKNYIAGRYGAIPYLGSLSAAIGVDDVKEEDIAEENSREQEQGDNDSDLSATPSGDAG